MGGSADRTVQVAAYPRMRGAPPVTHCRPGRVNPSLRNRTLKCSMALAIVQVSNWRMASKIAGESGCTVVAADTALCFVRENAIFCGSTALEGSVRKRRHFLNSIVRAGLHR